MTIVAIVFIVVWLAMELWAWKVIRASLDVYRELTDAYEALAIENEHLKESLASYEAIIKRNFGEHL